MPIQQGPPNMPLVTQSQTTPHEDDLSALPLSVPTTMMPKPNKSATAVFAIPELLEMILVLLPAHDILRAQAVSRTFRDTITGSKQLQRLLFLEPSGAPPHIHASTEDINTLLLEKAVSLPAFQLRTLYPEPVFNSKLSIPQLDFTSGLDLAVSVSSYYVYIFCDIRREFQWQTLLDGYTSSSKDAAWRRMLVRQQPILEIQVILRSAGGHCQSRMTFPPTTTFGSIIDWMEAEHLAWQGTSGVVFSTTRRVSYLLNEDKVNELLEIIKNKNGPLAYTACQILRQMVRKIHQESFDQHQGSWKGRLYSNEDHECIWRARRDLEAALDSSEMNRE
ncbi:hypothetical protein CLAFUW4_14186 [Fulvia fulva]|nr:hypothetical protein CLAFUR4_14189 [Fulvia fulva]WPV22169.1 hypothetical protein CLAFUW4_14186 [Fulvia fulva]WPV37043.1 hypothetical protein CLAFUW7_14197 [Fulvia fulva]